MIQKAKKRRKTNDLAAAPPVTVRVAAYTRKSVTEGLNQEFNTLDAQREAVEAYVASQRGEGWTALTERYDDGGYTGANIERPAFQRLLRDIEAGNVDVVAVYKIDRLSRSLPDFARLMELFDRHGVTFVSITQQFNTTSSMGRLTLNILMSFAEFERETIAERTRDKITASRRRGMWTGGRPVLGYDVVDKKLVVSEEEAERVRAIADLYLELGSLLPVVAELKRRGWTTKTWTNKAGKLVRGGPFNKTSLHGLLTNPLYIGKVRCGDEVCAGAHDAIIPMDTWDAVQAQLRGNAQRRSGPNGSNKWCALLKGLAYCTCGAVMSPTYTTRGSKRYSYYVCAKSQKEGVAACPGSRVASGDLEAFVVERLREVGRHPEVLLAALDADAKDCEARRPELVGEVRRLGAERARLASERENIVDAVAQGSSASVVLLPRLDEADRELTDVAQRESEAQRELAALETGDIDQDELTAALEDFEVVWAELFPKERARLLTLLLARVEFDAQAGDVAITFRRGGPQGMER